MKLFTREELDEAVKRLQDDLFAENQCKLDVLYKERELEKREAQIFNNEPYKGKNPEERKVERIMRLQEDFDYCNALANLDSAQHELGNAKACVEASRATVGLYKAMMYDGTVIS